MTITYESTRNKNIKNKASEAILKGLSDDGGLYVPNNYQNINIDISKILDLNYRETAKKILASFFTDFTEEELNYAVKNAYDNKFDSEEVVPLENIGDYEILELYHGRTLAFKDVALSILPYLMKLSKEKNKIEEDILILTATSGDTGKAALEGFRDVEGIDIAVFYPDGGVSKIQELQMKTQEGKNTHVFGVKGNFDDAQNIVKKTFNNNEIKEYLLRKNTILSSANSINIGRLIPQIVYYFTSYVSLIKNKRIKKYEKINFVVPTGNFGNILAGYLAKEIGLPVNKLICASNENNVLTEFFNTGEYSINRKFIKTISPSMDILISSNLERLLYFLNDGDTEYIKELMENLQKKGKYLVNEQIKNKMDKVFWSDYSTEQETLNTIKQMKNENNYLVDTHTAVAIDVYNKYRETTKDLTKTVILSTASPFKFIESIHKALKIEMEKEGKDLILEFSKEFQLEVPEGLNEILEKQYIHNKVIEIDKVKEEIFKIIDNEEENV